MKDIEHGAVTHDCAIMAILAKLSDEERQYFTWNKVEGLSPRTIAIRFGWSMVKINRVKHRLDRHLRELRCAIPAPAKRPRTVTDDVNIELRRRPDGTVRAKSPAAPIYSFARGGSLNPFFRERLSNSLATWALTPSKKLLSPPALTPTKQKERTDLTPNREAITADAMRKGMPKPMSTDEKLKSELARATEQLAATHRAVETAETEFREARLKLNNERSLGPAQTPSLQRKLSNLEMVVEAKKAALLAAQGKREEEQNAMARIEGEFRLAEHNQMLPKLRPVAKHIEEKIEELLDLILEADEIMSGHHVSPREFFVSARESSLGYYLDVLFSLRRLRQHEGTFFTDSRFYRAPREAA